LKLLSKAGIFLISLFLLVACSSGSEEDLGDAAYLDADETQSLTDFFNGTSDEKAARAADVAATNTQTFLLVGILGVALMILIVVVLKNKKKEK